MEAFCCNVETTDAYCGDVLFCALSCVKAVKDTKELREAVEEVQPEQVKLGLRLSQSKPIYEGFKALREGSVWDTLTEGQQRVIEGELRDFVLGEPL